MYSLVLPFVIAAAAGFAVGAAVRRILWRIVYCIGVPLVITVIFWWSPLHEGGDGGLGALLLAPVSLILGVVACGVGTLIGSRFGRSVS
jgi:hypothetical protein